MIHAYDKLYMPDAACVLGRMLDLAVYELGMSLKDFYALFLKSGVAAELGDGDVRMTVGMSGEEVLWEVLERSGAAGSDIGLQRRALRYAVGRSPEYWCGWALAHYQWETGLSFAEIERRVPVEDVLALYSPYHEMDIRQFYDRMNELCRSAEPETNLKRLRQSAGLSQSELARAADVPVRTIQQYEQRQKNINFAQVERLLKLSRALHCAIEDLVEKVG